MVLNNMVKNHLNKSKGIVVWAFIMNLAAIGLLGCRAETELTPSSVPGSTSSPIESTVVRPEESSTAAIAPQPIPTNTDLASVTPLPSSTNTPTPSPTPTGTLIASVTIMITQMPPPTLAYPELPTGTPCLGYFCDTGLQDKPAGWQIAITAGWLGIGFAFGIIIINGRFGWLTGRSKNQ